MGRESRPQPRNRDRHTTPRIALHLEQPLLDALEAWRSAQRAAPPQSEAVRTAIREMLTRDGFWPPK